MKLAARQLTAPAISVCSTMPVRAADPVRITVDARVEFALEFLTLFIDDFAVECQTKVSSRMST
jgi:hypothetical protein